MNHNPTDMYYSAHISAPQSQVSQSAPPALSQYAPHHQHSSSLQSAPSHYSASPATYNQYGNYSNGLTSPQSSLHHVSGALCHQGNVLPLPGNIAGIQNTISGSNFASQPGYDASGQVAPPGVKPKVTATLWEDEGSLCFQVEAKGVCVARREDNHMINGTKLLNVAGMTRGRRDGILKSEKLRHVVKIGPMHLKGVWIPFERALEFANKEKITELLYPLFVHNIGALLYHPTNSNRTNSVIAASERRKQEQNQMRNSSTSHGFPSFNQHHHHSMGTGLNANQISNNQHHSVTPHPQWSRSSIDRVQNFPTPPTSASSLMGSVSNSEGNFQWGQSQGGIGNIPNTASLSIETGLNASRSMPTTPASTPPGTSIQNIQYQQQQQQANQSYEISRQVFTTSSSQQNAYSSSNSDHQGISRYQQPNTYTKNEMGPPTARSTTLESDGNDVKDTGNLINSQNQIQPGHDEEREQGQNTEYTHGNSSSFDSARATYNYGQHQSTASMSSDHPVLANESSGSPNNHPSSSAGRATPRTTTAPQQFYSQSPAYSASPRAQGSSSNLYSVMSSERRSTNGNSGNDLYVSQNDINSSNHGYQPQQQIILNGTTTGNKRARDNDDEGCRPRSRDTPGETDGVKRRNTNSSSGTSSNENSGLTRPRPPILQRRR
ncbi:Cell pattern formation-associated protein STUA [Golovinomyces cichoracearum]|uniref:Cell pattern formation-associated protein STUA n=1 Tax=Golovinomyces cichoracearum TaxID=62708 RepID=A0A420IGP0_9PEZI|nr:Cell pattern formation-associated protein STUA [Golovinomyces cichoracearum]